MGTIASHKNLVGRSVSRQREPLSPRRPGGRWRPSILANQRKAVSPADSEQMSFSVIPHSLYGLLLNRNPQMYLMIARFQFDCEIDLGAFLGMFFKAHHHQMISVRLQN